MRLLSLHFSVGLFMFPRDCTCDCFPDFHAWIKIFIFHILILKLSSNNNHIAGTISWFCWNSPIFSRHLYKERFTHLDEIWFEAVASMLVCEKYLRIRIRRLYHTMNSSYYLWRLNRVIWVPYLLSVKILLLFFPPYTDNALKMSERGTLINDFDGTESFLDYNLFFRPSLERAVHTFGGVAF